MTNFNQANRKIPFPWRKDPQGVVEVNSILELIQQPVLLVDRKKGLIWGANEAFAHLSNMDRKYLIGLKVVSIFSGIEEKVLPVVENEDAMLLRKKQESLPVALRAKGIDGNQQLFLLLVEVEPEQDQQLEKFRKLFTQTIVKLSELNLDLDFDKAIQTIAGSIINVFDASALAIYQADSASPRLNRVAEAGEADIFPDTISSTNLIRLSKMVVWQRGKRLATEIHQAGHDRGMNFVGSVPLGQPGRLFGLLAVAGRENPDERLENMLDIFGAQITRYIECFLLAENLRKESESLKRSMLSFQAIMENSQEGVLVLDSSMNVLAMNPAAEWMLGYADQEVRGQKVDSILIGADGLVPALAAAAKGMPTHNLGNVSLHRRDGHLFPAHIQTIPVGADDEITALVVLVVDISQDEEIRTRSQQLEQRAILGEVTAVFAHEVRNPINNIYTGLQLLASTLPEDDPNQDNLVRLQNDCVRLNHLMESVLNFSRNTQYKFEKVELEPLLRRLLDRWYPRFAKVKVNYFIQQEKDTPPAKADPRALEQVFTNLISNATDAMSKSGGTLAVRIAPKNDLPNRSQIVVTISDNGPGIPDEIRERIFEPFVTTKSNGTGLGLAITKRILTAHHGSIKANSFPGGTMVEVTLMAYNGDEP